MKNVMWCGVFSLCGLMLGCVEQEDPEQTAMAPQQAEEGATLSEMLEESLNADSKSDTAQLEPGVFVSGVPSTRFELAAGPDDQGKQRKDLWCWAATTQMVLNFHGVSIVQEDIVQRAFGDLRNMGASSATQIGQVIEGWSLVDRQGKSWALDAKGTEQVDLIPMIEDLHFNSPLIVALYNEQGMSGDGHAYVLSAMTYRVDARGFVFPISVDLRDPWPESPSHSRISWEEFMSRYWGHVRVRAYPAQ
jgi:hypothetical protein